MSLVVKPERRRFTVGGNSTTPLEAGWEMCATEASVAATPDDLPASLDWVAASVPGTVASSFGATHLDQHPEYDAQDWWYRASFEAPGRQGRVLLHFDGLATLAEVWLNGHLIHASANMFVPAAVDVTDKLLGANRLVVVFRSLDHIPTPRRPRPHWKTRLVSKQSLRWHRTTLLGRIRGWTPRISPVGPWRPIWLEVVTDCEVTDEVIHTDWHDGVGSMHLS